jgi:GTP-binding protein EngB required for normal cell division
VNINEIHRKIKVVFTKMDKILFQYISIINDFISRKTKNIDKLVIPTTFIIPAPGKLTIQNMDEITKMISE